jgi:hypothetical protein
MFVSKYFARRGLLIVTSNLLDELSRNGSSREFMFLVGRQLGLIKLGFFRLWVFRHLLGRFAFFFYDAWQRRSHLTADKLGLLVCGDLFSAEQALLVITVGSALSPATNMRAIEEQRERSFESVWTWLRLAGSSYPFLVDRVSRLRAFAMEACREHISASRPLALGALPLVHRWMRSFFVMIVHGHDQQARAELEAFMLKRFPHVNPIAMIAEEQAAHTLPEKFEKIAGQVRGAIAILTPDDLARAVREGEDRVRARQNVVVEVGWFWGRLGRGRCLLLKRGDLELPSDLSGVEVHSFKESPNECSEVIRDFIARLEGPEGS